MKRFLIGLWLALGGFASLVHAQATPATIVDTLYNADGSKATCTLYITNPAFLDSTNHLVPANTIETLVRNGALSVSLVPSTTAVSLSTFYTVHYACNNGPPQGATSEFWAVPPGSNLTLGGNPPSTPPIRVAPFISLPGAWIATINSDGSNLQTLTAASGTNVTLGITNNGTGNHLFTVGWTGTLAIALGGNGTASPSLTAGSNITLGGTWPNYTINAPSPTLTAGTGISITGAWPNTTITNTLPLAIGTNITSATQGSVLFAGASGALSQDAVNLFYSSANAQMCIGCNNWGGDTTQKLRVVSTTGTDLFTLSAASGNFASGIVTSSGGGGSTGDHAYTGYSQAGVSKWTVAGVWNGVADYLVQDASLNVRLKIAQSNGAPTFSFLGGHGTVCLQTDNSGDITTAASACGGGAGSGTVNSGTVNHLAYYASSTNAVSDAGADLVYDGTHTYSSATTLVFDIHTAAHTLPAKAGANASKPATCTTGELYVATDLTLGQQLLFCSAGNVWTQQLNSGTSGITSLTTDVTATGPGAAAATVVQIEGAAIPVSGLIVGTNASKQLVAAALASANIFVGNGSNLPAAVAVTGDITLSNAGATAVVKVNGGAVPASALVIASNSSNQLIAAALASADIWVGNGSNLPIAVSPGGDVTMTNAGVFSVVKVNGAVVPTSSTVLGSNITGQLVNATVQGNGAKVQLSTGTTTANDCVKYDGNGNTVDAGGACSGGGGGLTGFSNSNTTTVLTIQNGIVSCGGIPINISTTGTVTLGVSSAAAGSTLWVRYDCVSQALIVDFNANMTPANVTVSNVTKGIGSQTAFVNGVPIVSCTAGATPDTYTSCTDWRSPYHATQIAAGANIAISTDSKGTMTVSTTGGGGGCTISGYVLSCSGTTYVPWNLMVATTPSATGYTLRNPGSYTNSITTSGGARIIQIQSTGSAGGLAETAALSSGQADTSTVECLAYASNNGGCFVILYESATGKACGIGMTTEQNGAGDRGFQALAVYSFATISSSPGNLVRSIFSGGDRVVLQAGYTSPNITFSYSIDGVNFMPYYSEAATAHCFTTAPDSAGNMVVQNDFGGTGTTNNVTMTVRSRVIQ